MFTTTSSMTNLSKIPFFHSSVRKHILPETKETLLDLNVLGDGNCMYYAIILGYLLPVKNDVDEFNSRMEKLFNLSDQDTLAYYKSRLDNYRGEQEIFKELCMEYLVNSCLRPLLATFIQNLEHDFIAHVQIEDIGKSINSCDWGDSTVLIGLSEMLKLHIRMYVFGDKEIEKVDFECGNEHPNKIYLIFVRGNHFHLLIDPQCVNAIFPEANIPVVISTLKTIGQNIQGLNEREKEIVESFRSFSLLNPTLPQIKKFVFDQFYDLPNFKCKLAKAIELFSATNLFVNLDENKDYLINCISEDQLKRIGDRYLKKYPEPTRWMIFFKHDHQKQARQLQECRDPASNEILTNPSCVQLWYLVLRIYSTLSSPKEELALDIMRIINRAFIHEFSIASNSCKEIACRILGLVVPLSDLENEKNKILTMGQSK